MQTSSVVKRRTGYGAAAVAAVLTIAGAGVGVWAIKNLKVHSLAQRRTRAAGFSECSVQVNGTRLHYASGPTSSGPPLLLIHGQGVDWRSYAPVLPALARDFSVFAVDVYGHGDSARAPEKYSAAVIGHDLASFIESVIGQPVVVSGHSSGGQLAAWLAGHRPDLISAVVLEDPPLFTTLLPRAEKTWNWVDLATTCHDFLESEDTDWAAYSFAHQRLWTFFGDGGERIIRSGLRQHEKHPKRPITMFFMPSGWNDMQRSLLTYDPSFGDAFFTGSWDEGFDHEDTLRRIEAPTTLIHADWEYDPDGVLQGAIDDADAQRIASLNENIELVRVESGHNVHGEKPDRFVDLLRARRGS